MRAYVGEKGGAVFAGKEAAAQLWYVTHTHFIHIACNVYDLCFKIGLTPLS